MPLFVLFHNNGEEYEQNETKLLGVFDDFKLIKKYADKEGYTQDKVDRFLFERGQESLLVEMTKANEINASCT